MSEGYIDRRRVLTFGAASVLGVWSALGGSSMQTLKAQQPDPSEDEGLFYFGITIPGLPEASRNIREVAIDELTIDARETTTGLDGDVRISPRRVHFGSATFTSAVAPGASKYCVS